jgi:phosphate transport system substrate-binding protein
MKKNMIWRNKILLKKYSKWLSVTAALLLAGAVAFSGCAGTPEASDGESGSFKIIGSNTVTPLSSLWAEQYMKDNSGVSIAVSGPGSGVGIASLIDSITDICQASRLIKSTEIDQARAKGVEPYEIKVATDALSVIVNPANPVQELTFAELSAIYTGKITNWKEVGGNDAPIVALSRDNNSGTHAYFLEEVVQMAALPTKDTSLEYGGKVLLLPSTEEGVSQVASNQNAIFYSGLGYVSDKVKTLGIKKTAADTAVKPSVENALNGTYPISRPLLYYTNGAPTGVIKSYIDYCLSADGQKIVGEAGFVPLTK